MADTSGSTPHAGEQPVETPCPFAALDLVPDAVLVLDEERRVIALNHAATTLAAADRDSLVGRPVADLLVNLPTEVDGPSLASLQVDGAMPLSVEVHSRRAPAGSADRSEVTVLSLRPVHVDEAPLVDAERLAHIGSWSWRIGEDHVTWSAELHRIYGLSPRDGPVSYDDYVAMVHPDDRSRVAQAVRRAMRTHEPWHHDYRIIRPDGTERWVSAGGQVLEQQDGEASRLGGYCRDITAQRQAEARRQRAQDELASQQKTLEQVVRGQPLEDTLIGLCHDIEVRFPGAICSILLVDPDGTVLRDHVAPSHPKELRRAIDGLPIAEGSAACGTAAHRAEPVVVADILTDPLTSHWAELAKVFELRSVWSHPLTRGDGRVAGTFALYRRAVHHPDDEEISTVSAAANLAALALEREESQEALRRAAELDPLTDLPNRATFLRRLQRRLDVGEPAAVLFLDLDHFKWINDSLGHPQGDRILAEVAHRMQSAVDPAHLVARFGGDEFTVLVCEGDEAKVHSVADDVLRAFDAPFELDGGSFFLSASVGIAVPDGSPVADDLIRDADAAMYRAKELGRDRHVLFDDGLRGRAMARVRTESQIRESLAQDRFELHFQLAVDLHRNRWTGAEALARWRHPDGHLALPGDFIPLAEETGLIGALGRQVLAQTISHAARWVGSDLLDAISCNVSVHQLQDPMLPAHVAQLLEDHGLPPSRLVLEVTESAMMHELDTARTSLLALRELGVRLVIDDFGTGFSSIARLRDLPIWGLKIDPSFAQDLDSNAQAADMVASVVGLAHAAGLTVCIEGIENPAALAVARATGCDLAQGFLLAMPAPPEEVEDLVTRPPQG